MHVQPGPRIYPRIDLRIHLSIESVLRSKQCGEFNTLFLTQHIHKVHHALGNRRLVANHANALSSQIAKRFV